MLDGALVAIEAQDAPTPALAASAVQGCESALGRGRCIAAGVTSTGAPWYARIRVLSTSDGGHLIVEVTREGEPFRTRDLEFNELDQAQLRWKAAGVVIAAIITGRGRDEPEAQRPEPVAPPPEPPLTPPPLPPPLPAPEPTLIASEPLLSGFEFGAILGPGLDQGEWQFGAALRLKVAVGQTDTFVAIGAESAAVPSSLFVLGSSGSLGYGARLLNVPTIVSLDLSAHLVAQWLWVRVQDPSGSRDAGGKGRIGGALGLDSLWRTTGCWATVVGGRATLLRPEVEVRVGGDIQAVVPALNFLGFVGIQLDLGGDC
jgi:hypothetical protein